MKALDYLNEIWEDIPDNHTVDVRLIEAIAELQELEKKEQIKVNKTFTYIGTGIPNVIECAKCGNRDGTTISGCPKCGAGINDLGVDITIERKKDD